MPTPTGPARAVTVVFTEHEENGRCSSAELLTLLEGIKPDVIFLECPAAAFDTYLTKARLSLEAITVSRYGECFSADLVPVDLPTPEVSLFENYRNLIDRVARTGPGFDRLASWHRQYVNFHGFAYLNSDYCSDLFAQQNEMIRAAIRTLGDRRLNDHYELWIETNKNRDRAMVSHILDYGRRSPFNRSAFLVGAAHRRSILDLTRESPEAPLSTIRWEFLAF